MPAGVDAVGERPRAAAAAEEVGDDADGRLAVAGSTATRRLPLIPGVQHACASCPATSEASIIFANACATTSCVESVAMIEAMLTAAGLSALLTSPPRRRS